MEKMTGEEFLINFKVFMNDINNLGNDIWEICINEESVIAFAKKYDLIKQDLKEEIEQDKHNLMANPFVDSRGNFYIVHQVDEIFFKYDKLIKQLEEKIKWEKDNL